MAYIMYAINDLTRLLQDGTTTFCKTILESAMGKGPRPKGEYAGKSSVFSTRIRPDLRKNLERAAKTSGRSLSQEVEHRLRRSFVEDDKIADVFGDRRTYRLMRLMSDAIQFVQKHENDENWLDDPFRFRFALIAMLSVVEAIAPSVPSIGEAEENTTGLMGAAAAAEIWRGVAEAKRSIELGSGSRADHINSIARSDMGEDVIRRALPAIEGRVRAAFDAMINAKEHDE
jgi:predicted HicB family RNase H-like nuclease